MRLRPLLCTLIGLAGLALCQTEPASLSKDLEVSASQDWVDTGLDLRAGDTVQITATGSVNVGGASPAGPNGASRGFRDLIKAYPVNAVGGGALIGRLGSSEAAQAFLVGATKQYTPRRAGKLFLGVNKSSFDRYSGSFAVKIAITARGPETSAAPVNLKLPEVTVEMVDRIPRRVNDGEGTLGDNTNFVIVGQERKVLSALEAAGWVQVDRENRDAMLSTIMATLSKQAYLKLPMSQLMLFGRVQDYGMAHAEPIAVVARRHHFRIWKAPFQVDGQELWVGAGTHDIGFDKDQRNGNITHKIDPDVDLEREFIGQSLNETGQVAKLSYVMPSKPNKTSKTAHGEEYHSDGRLLVIHMMPDAASASAGGSPEQKFANTFCSVLTKKNPDGGTWPACPQLMDAGGSATVDLPALTNKYRVLIVPGFFSACTSSTTPPFGTGQDLLRKQGITVEMWVPPNDSSEANGAAIAKYLQDHMLTDQRKYIAIGYSKGAPDIQSALAMNPAAKDAVAGFVSLAGAVGGSAIADVLPAQAQGWIQRYKLGSCTGDIGTAFNSLKRETRRAFLAQYPTVPVPSYSIPAVSTLQQTSKAMQETWRLMNAIASRHDSQLALEDAVIPGSQFLGTAHADHLAVALPFDQATDASIRALADQGRYPRAALLEAIYRYVSDDLDHR